jgi:5-methylcytosine-specific restriction endonuclease McrA
MALRTVFFQGPLRKSILDGNRIERPYIKKDGTTSSRPRVFYACSACGIEMKQVEVAVDHIEPVVELDGFKDWNTYIGRLFCDPSNLRILCKPCHKQKTGEERKQRNANVKAV